MLHHNTKLGNKMFCGSKNTIWTITDILNHCCDLDFECSNPLFHRILRLMMLFYQTMFGCKWTSSLEDIVEMVIFAYLSPLCDLHIEDSEPSFEHDSPPCDNTPPCQVWLKMVERCRRYRPDKLRHTVRRTDGQTVKVIPIYPPPRIYTGGGGGMKLNEPEGGGRYKN